MSKRENVILCTMFVVGLLLFTACQPALEEDNAEIGDSWSEPSYSKIGYLLDYGDDFYSIIQYADDNLTEENSIQLLKNDHPVAGYPVTESMPAERNIRRVVEGRIQTSDVIELNWSYSIPEDPDVHELMPAVDIYREKDVEYSLAWLEYKNWYIEDIPYSGERKSQEDLLKKLISGIDQITNPDIQGGSISIVNGNHTNVYTQWLENGYQYNLMVNLGGLYEDYNRSIDDINEMRLASEIIADASKDEVQAIIDDNGKLKAKLNPDHISQIKSILDQAGCKVPLKMVNYIAY